MSRCLCVLLFLRLLVCKPCAGSLGGLWASVLSAAAKQLHLFLKEKKESLEDLCLFGA